MCQVLPDITPKNGELTPASPCLIKRLGQDDLERAISFINKGVEHQLRMITRDQARRGLLATFKKNADNIPILPDNRGHDHFYVDGSIAFYDGNGGTWRTTTVIQLNRGTIAFAYHRDRNYGGGIGTPTVMRIGEFEYFRDHPDKFRDWLYLSDRSYNGERLPIEAMYQALIDYAA
jgi:hypothetical protein